MDQKEVVPLLSPCPPPPAPAMLSKNVGGKFKYLNRKNSEFLAGNSNANAKCIMQMDNAKANSPEPKIFAQTPKFSPEPEKFRIFGGKFKCKMQNAKSPKPKIFARTQHFRPNRKFSPEPKIFAQPKNFAQT